MKEMGKTYNPQEFESRIYESWCESGAFTADNESDKPPYTIVLPPPNITGRLHEGHALNHTMQDILIRFKRKQGYEALWLPGTDHASIATEVRILQMIKREEGRSKEELTREEFLERAWQWKEEYGSAIVNQMKKLGNSCDWTRERFTMDEGLSEAVKEAFIQYYEEGLIYRGNRLINWCPDCGTSLSEAEVDHSEDAGAFYDIFYPVEGTEEKIIISTTRPETMLGDTAVAVHPEDERYLHLIGKQVVLPLVGRVIPIISDDYVDREMGTGALKVTPAHDPNDYEIGKRHNLETINIFTEDAKIEEGYDYTGLDRFEARKKIVEDLRHQGYLKGVKDHLHAVGHCYRCKNVVEPRISDQWFLKMDELAAMAQEAVQKDEMQIVPEHFEKIYHNWLDHIHDWCISRQLWWGHRIPAYYCQDCGEIMVSRDEVSSCSTCHSSAIEQDPDVLDTWFSSALWPFSTLGWPHETKDLAKFYPNNILVTGWDIIFFWVIRMMFSGLKFMGESPFPITLINGIVRDAQGRKISKSLDNGTDPIEIIDQYGADALRFMLVSGTSIGNDTRFMIDRVETARNFANKLWNASRFVLSQIDDRSYIMDPSTLTSSDKWILKELDATINQVTRLLEQHDLGLAADTVLDFSWNKYCDWYIELSKKRIYSEDQQTKDQIISVLLYVLEAILHLLHPFMPFITEEIWSHVPEREEQLVVSAWPEPLGYEGEDTTVMETLMEAIRRIRNLRAEMDIPPSKKSRVFIKGDDALMDGILSQKEDIQLLMGASDVLVKETELENASVILINGLEITLPLDDLIDYEKEYKRLSTEKEKLTAEIKRATAKLDNAGFTEKAPAELVQKERDKLQNYKDLLIEIETKINQVEEHLGEHETDA